MRTIAVIEAAALDELERLVARNGRPNGKDVAVPLVTGRLGVLIDHGAPRWLARALGPT